MDESAPWSHFRGIMNDFMSDTLLVEKNSVFEVCDHFFLIFFGTQVTWHEIARPQIPPHEGWGPMFFPLEFGWACD